MKLPLACSILGVVLLLTGCRTKPQPAVAVYSRPEATGYYYSLVSPGTKFATLPSAVQNTVRAETGGAEIEDIVKDTSSGQKVYRIYFINYEAFPPLYVGSDGSILNKDLSVAMGAPQDKFGVLTGGRN